jgi:hypothetical protein
MNLKPALPRLAAALITLVSVMCLASPDAAVRCGWFDNPTPGNAWLYDRDGEWTIGIQGGHQSEGRWPRFKSSQWVRTGTGSHGHGCACLKVQADNDAREITRIVSSQARPLSACRRDAALEGKEPERPPK